MVWKKLNDYVSFYNIPSLGTENLNNGKRFMALTIDSSSKNPFKGVARQVLERIGNEDIPGYVDRSRLVLVESLDLLNWKVKSDLKIKNIDEIIKQVQPENSEFIGLEDPDIIKSNDETFHLYFTIAFKLYNGLDNDVDRYKIFIGHAIGKSLDNLSATMPVLEGVDSEFSGFKEICPVKSKNDNLMLVETFVDRGLNLKYSAVGLVEINNNNQWKFKKLLHDPEKESRSWCSGHSSPCRLIDPDILNINKFHVGIINGREKTKKINDLKMYGKFRPGLFLFDPKKEEIVWLDDTELFEDPLATTITFSSEIYYLDNKEAILYAHPNDSFIRAYKIDLDKIKEYIFKKIKLK